MVHHSTAHRIYALAAAVFLFANLAVAQGEQAASKKGAAGEAVATLAEVLDDDRVDSRVENVSFLADAQRLGSGLGLSEAASRGQFYAGGEYLSIRSTFSENIAFVVTETDPTGTPITSTFVPLLFSYDGSYRAFAGYRVPDCGCEIEFGFTNFSSGASPITSPAAVGVAGTPGSTSVASPSGDISTAAPGDTLTASGGVDAQVFDLSFSRTIPLGSPPACCSESCGSCCGDTCCGGWCPAWDITWSGGLRYGDVDWFNTSAENGGLNATSTTTLDFNGFGARFGMEGRRYFGRSQWFSLFLKGDISLLLGDLNIQTQEGIPTAAGGVLPTNTVTFSNTQIVPVTDIVIGGTAQITSNFTATAGYLLSAWHDLGNRATVALDPATQAIPNFSLDDANILSFDGLFIRGEYSF